MLVITLTLVAVLAGGVSLANALGNRLERERVLRFIDVRQQVDYLDVGRPAEGDFDPSPGDTFFFSNALRHPNTHDRAGSFLSRCTALIGTEFHCAGTLRLPRGTVELAATVDFAEGGTIVSSVVGGTRHFLNTGGQARIVPTSTSGRSRLIVRLIPID